MKKLNQILLISSSVLLASCAQESNVASQKQDKKSDKTVNEKAKDELIVDVVNQERKANKGKLILTDVSAQREKESDIKSTKTKLMAEQLNADYASHSVGNHKLATTGNFAMQPPINIQSRMRVLPVANIVNRENYTHVDENGTHLVAEQPVSTFSIDVDTASYANVRRILNQGQLPPYDAVRVEELINYFNYTYPQPDKSPFAVYTEVGPSPYNQDKQLIHIGIQGKDIENAQRPASNLVFLIDVSGSMNNANKIGLLKNGLKMLVNQLNEHDSVAIVVYAGAAGTVLEPTAGDNKYAITDALTRLSAGGSTNGAAGIKAAYNLARQSFIKDGINRVIIATDGDFNVGTVSQQSLKELIVQQRKSGIALSVLGLGQGNYNDALMQELAQNGNGNAYYIDTLNEARKVLVEEMSSTLMTIAKDVKIQIEFNPNVVSEYRLIGYETRALKREDFNNDKIDAGEIGAGHTVTAIYEISLHNGKNKQIDALRYQSEKVESTRFLDDQEIAFLRLRYKQPSSDTSKLIEQAISIKDIGSDLAAMSDIYKFSAAVAGFAQELRGGNNLSTMDLAEIIRLAQQSKADDKYGYKGEFINMVKLAQALTPNRLANDDTLVRQN